MKTNINDLSNTSVNNFTFVEDRTEWKNTDIIDIYTNKVNDYIYIEAIVISPWRASILMDEIPKIVVYLHIIINKQVIKYSKTFIEVYWSTNIIFKDRKWFKKHFNDFKKNISLSNWKA